MKTLEAVAAEVSAMRDKLGQPVEAGIFDAVVALQWKGFVTQSSCVGHPEREGGFYPHITLAYPEPADEWDIKQREPWLEKNLQQQSRLVALLTLFYAQRPHTPLDLMLIPNTFGASIVELRPLSGQVSQFVSSPAERRALHKKYLDEFSAFTQFLLGLKD